MLEHTPEVRFAVPQLVTMRIPRLLSGVEDVAYDKTHGTL